MIDMIVIYGTTHYQGNWRFDELLEIAKEVGVSKCVVWYDQREDCYCVGFKLNGRNIKINYCHNVLEVIINKSWLLYNRIDTTLLNGF